MFKRLRRRREMDRRAFTDEPYARRIDKPWGYELHWVPDDMPYMGKLLHINAGARLSLQVHDRKCESWLLLRGRAQATLENSVGELTAIELRPGQGYSVRVGQKHRLGGITECDIIEVSTPEAGTTWRLEDDYHRAAQTPAERAREYAAK